MTRKPLIRGFVAVLLALAACASPSAGPSSGGSTPEPRAAAAASRAERSVAAAEQSINAQDVRARIFYLASDELKGRDTPSPGLEQAAEYIGGEFRASGLRPAGDAGGYIQRYPYRRSALDASTAHLSTGRAGAWPALAYASDFFVVPAAVDSAAGGAVFVGPITGVMQRFPAEVRGRIAVATIPPQLGGEILMAARSAAEAGAAGLLLVLHPVHTAEVVGAAAASLAGAGIEAPVPVFGVRHDHARSLFTAAGLDPALLDPDAAAPATPAALPQTTLHLRAVVRRAEHQVPNVVAVLPGSDPVLRDEYVVLSAHFDHVGVGAPNAAGDSIYNGADDDASGTSVVLEVAEAMARLPAPPARSIVFLAVSGEEKGLLGSRHFADHPTVPIEKVVANINLDMVGRNAPDTVVAIGQEYTSLGPLAHRIAADRPELGLKLVADPDPSERVFFRSDHVVFVRKEIPAIFFTTWLHDDYHKPSDEPDRIDAEKVARIGRFVFHLAHEIATAPEPPTWQGDSLEQVREILKSMPF